MGILWFIYCLSKGFFGFHFTYFHCYFLFWFRVVFITVWRQGVKKVLVWAVQEDEIVVVGSLYTACLQLEILWHLCGHGVAVCNSRGQPSSSVTSLQDSWCYFPIVDKPCGSAEQNEILFLLDTSSQLLNFAHLAGLLLNLGVGVNGCRELGIQHNNLPRRDLLLPWLCQRSGGSREGEGLLLHLGGAPGPPGAEEALRHSCL